MRPPTWNPPIELSATEQIVAKRIRKAKLFLFLREIRHSLFDEQFQQELASKLFKDSTMGKCPVPPAQLALFIDGLRSLMSPILARFRLTAAHGVVISPRISWHHD